MPSSSLCIHAWRHIGVSLHCCVNGGRFLWNTKTRVFFLPRKKRWRNRLSCRVVCTFGISVAKRRKNDGQSVRPAFLYPHLIWGFLREKRSKIRFSVATIREKCASSLPITVRDTTRHLNSKIYTNNRPTRTKSERLTGYEKFVLFHLLAVRLAYDLPSTFVHDLF